MLLCKKIDLDLEDPVEIYTNAKETVAYLNDVIKTLEARALDGEEMDGFKVVEGRKSRQITDEGIKYLAEIFGREKIYNVTEKPIGITALETFATKEEVDELVKKGYITYKAGKPKVIVEKKGE